MISQCWFISIWHIYNTDDCYKINLIKFEIDLLVYSRMLL